MRTWLLSNTLYGTWLPGDRRGCVISVRDRRLGDPDSPFRFEHDMPGEVWEDEMPGLYHYAREHLKGPPIYLHLAQAETLLAQFQGTATYRTWSLLAVAIMANHWHAVLQVHGDPNPKKLLADLKAYGTRALNRAYGQPPSETWWTGRGSKRKLRNDLAIAAGTNYVLFKQPHPLVVWSPTLGRLV